MEYSSLFTFVNANSNYQLLTTFELYMISAAPEEVRRFICKNLFTEEQKHHDSDSCGEGLDYRLEEKNKKFKEYLHVVFPTFDDWVTACSNTVELEKMNSSQKEDYNNIREATGVTGPDYGSRVKYCRSRLRSMGYFNPEKVIAI